ncbi:MAG: nucleotidyltransferase family protein [Patulibacter sp.]|nr:nucleotidyltransferase family protein [Patulibacter sp.]
MRAVIMAGGLGMRMRPYTTVLPKPLLPIGDRPILSILLDQLAAAGVRRVDLCVGYLSGLIQAYLLEAAPPREEMEVVFHLESEPLGTAGALREVSDLDEPFLLLNGDVLTSLDFAALLGGHTESGAALTVTVQTRSTTIASGVLAIDGEDRVSDYTEKPTLQHDVSLGIYALDPRALDQLGEGRTDVPDLVQALLASGEHVRAHRFAGEWFDIGTLSDHELAVQEFTTRREHYFPGRAGTSEPDAGTPSG